MSALTEKKSHVIRGGGPVKNRFKKILSFLFNVKLNSTECKIASFRKVYLQAMTQGKGDAQNNCFSIL